LVVRDLSSKM